MIVSALLPSILNNSTAFRGCCSAVSDSLSSRNYFAPMENGLKYCRFLTGSSSGGGVLIDVEDSSMLSVVSVDGFTPFFYSFGMLSNKIVL